VEAQDPLQPEAAPAPEAEVLQEVPFILQAGRQLPCESSTGPCDYNLPAVWPHLSFAIQIKIKKEGFFTPNFTCHLAWL
jgi:hypothetical protein